MAGRVPARLSRSEGRRFGLSVGLGFLALALLLAWRGKPAAAAVFAPLGVGLGLAGLALPDRLGPVYSAWMRLALAISKVTTPILLAVVYFGVITPIGLALRAAGHRPLGRRRDARSFWFDRPPGARQSDLSRQF